MGGARETEASRGSGGARTSRVAPKCRTRRPDGGTRKTKRISLSMTQPAYREHHIATRSESNHWALGLRSAGTRSARSNAACRHGLKVPDVPAGSGMRSRCCGGYSAGCVLRSFRPFGFSTTERKEAGGRPRGEGARDPYGQERHERRSLADTKRTSPRPPISISRVILLVRAAFRSTRQRNDSPLPSQHLGVQTEGRALRGN
jgi:hypothetical protein